MINFRHISYKNFLSTGNSPITISLNDPGITLLVGSSGSGKSTMIDALCFVLFGKAFRNINKKQLINSVNQKQLLVDIEFTKNGSNYKVIRGISPNIFEIYHNDKMINQDASMKDYQKVLEQQILGMSFKTFCQVVILGSSSYVPFMQQTAAGRREIIEDILDISVFGQMSQLNKINIADTNNTINKIKFDIAENKKKAESLHKMIEILSNKQKNEVNEIHAIIAEINANITRLEEERSVLNHENENLLKKIHDIDELTTKANEIVKEKTENNIKETDIRNNVNFFRENNNCPVCNQVISNEHSQLMVTNLIDKLGNIAQYKKEIDRKHKKIQDKIKQFNDLSSAITDNNTRIGILDTKISMLEKNLVMEMSKLDNKSNVLVEITDAKRELKEVAELVIKNINERKNLYNKLDVMQQTHELLSDSGIKTMIIREFVPIINSLLNMFLHDMELFVEFLLDENFNETIKSRHRDTFSYQNFSAGEQLRIDLALLFTWRNIAKIKNSVSTNLLILDEILTGKIDSYNVDILINLLHKISESNTDIIAIAHGENLIEKFSRVKNFEKQGNFSVISEK